MTTTDLQSLIVSDYATGLSIHDLAYRHHLGTLRVCATLRGAGVRMRARGGDWKTTPRATKIEAHRAANHASGDPAFRAAVDAHLKGEMEGA